MPLIAALTPREHNVTHTDEIVEPVRFDEPADLVGITAPTPSASSRLRSRARFRRRGVPVVIGGPHATALPEEAASMRTPWSSARPRTPGRACSRTLPRDAPALLRFDPARHLDGHARAALGPDQGDAATGSRSPSQRADARIDVTTARSRSSTVRARCAIVRSTRSCARSRRARHAR